MEGNDNQYQVLKGLREGEEIVISAQFMLDSESRLREAIEKMLEVKQAGAREMQGSGKVVNSNKQSASDDMDMSGITMESNQDDLDMSGMTMDESPQKSPSHQQ
jgi:Cu(I)/Ag(I) efflux system membrane fusion protein/cobalt-zinc-cadmium efflux system membrane fusion protein